MKNVLLKIREMLPDLNQTEQRIGAYILENPDDVLHLSIAQLAEMSGSSQAALVRFCKTLGFKGLKDIKHEMTSDIIASAREKKEEDEDYSDIKGSDSIQVIIEKVALKSIKSIDDTLKLLDSGEMEKAVKAVLQAQRVDFYGVGASGLVALDAQQKFLRIGKYSVASADPHFQINSAASLKKGDVAVMISYSGMTKDIIETLNVAKEAGATIIAITKYGKNQLSQKSDISLNTFSPEITIRSGAMGSRIAQLTVVDILFTGVASRDYDDLHKKLQRSYRYSTLKKYK